MTTTHRIRSRMLGALLLVFLAALLPACAAQEPSMQVLPALEQANLTGRLIFIQYQPKGSQLVQLDLATGAARTLFVAPEKSWLASAAVSPDGSSVVLAYAPPPPAGETQLNNTDLYRMPVDGISTPQPLLERAKPNESYAYPTWAPDGQSLYYTHSAPTTESRLGIATNIERWQPGGKTQVILPNATWPKLSPDGARLAYLGLSEFTSENSLYLANADGTGPTELVPASQFPIVDAPLFSPDGNQVYFTAPDGHAQPEPAPVAVGTGIPTLQAWKPALPFGVRPVTAHSEPADWYRVSVAGSGPQLLAEAKDVNMVAAFSPDGQWLAYASQKGLFVMKPDGSQRAQLASLAAMGSLDWLE